MFACLNDWRNMNYFSVDVSAQGIGKQLFLETYFEQ